MADEVISDLRSHTSSVEKTYAANLQALEKTVNSMVSSLSKTSGVMEERVNRFSDMNSVKMFESGFDPTTKLLGSMLKVVTKTLDAALALQDQYIKLSKEAVFTSIAFAKTGTDLDEFVRKGISMSTELRSSLHINQREWDAYMRSYKEYAVASSDMYIKIYDSAGNMSKTVTEGIFEISKRFDIDVAKTSKAFYETLSKGGPVSEDMSRAATDTLAAWRAVAVLAADAGSSSAKAFNLVSDVAIGTEKEVSSGSDRILSMADMYARLFSVMKTDNKQGLITEFFKAIESSMRTMSSETASLFSGVVTGNGILARSPGGNNAIKGALDLSAMIRTLKDPNTQRPVTHLEIFKGMIESMNRLSGNAKIISEEEYSNALPLDKRNLTEGFIKQQKIFDIMMPGLSRGAKWTMLGILKKIEDTGDATMEELKALSGVMADGEDSEAKKIQDQKTNYLQQISDVFGSWLSNLLFGNKVSLSDKKRNADKMFIMKFGTEAEDIRRQMSSKKGITEEQAKADREARKLEYLKKHYLYSQGSGTSWDEDSRREYAEIAQQIRIDALAAAKSGDKKYKALIDKNATPEQKNAAVESYIFQRYHDMSAGETVGEESNILQDVLNDQYAIAQLNAYTVADIRPRSFLGFERDPSINYQYIDRYPETGEEKKAKPKLPDNFIGPPEAFIGVSNTTEGEIRRLHEGEMVVPKNQSDIVRRIGGPMALLSRLGLIGKVSSQSEDVAGASDDLMALSGYTGGFLSSISILEAGIRQAKGMVSSGHMRHGAGNIDSAASGLEDSLNSFAKSMAVAASGVQISAAAQGGDGTGRHWWSIFSDLEYLFDKDSSDEIKKAGGTVAAAAAKQPKIPELLKLPAGVIESVGGQMTEEELMAFKFNIAYNESKNRYNATNKTTSATGKYQFLRATARGLWEQNKDMFKDLNISESDFNNIASYRKLMTDPVRGRAMQERLMNSGIMSYAKYIAKAGLPINQDTLATMHFMGPKGIKKIKEKGDSFLHSTFNPTAGTGIKNQTIGTYIENINSLGLEAFRGARMAGSLLDEQSPDLIEELANSPGADVKKALEESSGAVDMAYMPRESFGLVGLASGALSAFNYAAPSSSSVSAGVEDVVRKDNHVVVVPLVLSDGTALGSTCTINFDTTTVTSLMES